MTETDNTAEQAKYAIQERWSDDEPWETWEDADGNRWFTRAQVEEHSKQFTNPTDGDHQARVITRPDNGEWADADALVAAIGDGTVVADRDGHLALYTRGVWRGKAAQDDSGVETGTLNPQGAPWTIHTPGPTTMIPRSILAGIIADMQAAFSNEDDEYGNDDFRDDMHEVLGLLKSLL